jgi:hypothetical protein
MDKNKKRIYWRWLRTTVLIIALLTFTPLVIPQGVKDPMLMGVPYTLWVGFIQAVILVTLTFVGTKWHPGMDEEREVGS